MLQCLFYVANGFSYYRSVNIVTAYFHSKSKRETVQVYGATSKYSRAMLLHIYIRLAESANSVLRIRAVLSVLL